MPRLTHWIDTFGGPFICLATDLLDKWHGYSDPGVDPLDTSHDYGRACACVRSRFAGKVSVGDGSALIFGIGMSAVWQDEDKFPVVVEWEYADDESEVIAALRAMPDELCAEETTKYSTLSVQHVIFDSVMPGTAHDDHGAIQFGMPLGNYVVASTFYKPNDQTGLIVHRFLQE